jgi:magnesium-transporting ATPase (P-type)
MAIFNRGDRTHASADTQDTRDARDTGDVQDTRTTRTVERDRLHDEPVHDRAERAAIARANAHDRFGGINWGAAFFGWLVAVAVTLLLTSIIGAVVAAVSDSTNVTQTDADRQAGTIGMAAAITLIVVLALAYYTGGYVAGRMSRFDGAKQGLGTWLMGLVLTVLAVVIGWVAGDQYNVFDRVDLPRIPIPTDEATTGGIVVAVAVVVLTILTAMLGGKVGTRYHSRVDRAHVV